MMNRTRTLKVSRGFTLIELILYLAIVAVIVGSLVIFALTLTGLGVKSSQQEEVYSTASFISEKIKYEIRNATNINVSNSNFGVNLASSNNQGDQISLAESGTSNPTLIDVLNGNGQITLGSGTPTSLNPSSVEITNLTFTNLSSSNGTSKNLQFTLTVTDLSPSQGNIHETTTLESDAELRSNE